MCLQQITTTLMISAIVFSKQCVFSKQKKKHNLHFVLFCVFLLPSTEIVSNKVKAYALTLQATHGSRDSFLRTITQPIWNESVE